MKRIVRWGVIGCGNIANKFAESIVEVADAELVAVASNTPGKAEAFARKHDIGRFYGSYGQLLQDDGVDIVYIATTNNFHFRNAMQVLEAGKPLLCEKPFTVNSREMKELVRIASEKRLFMMEGMWTRFLPVMVQIRSWLDSRIIGEVKQVRATFGFNCPFDPDNRLYNLGRGGGALLDAGVYSLSFANMVMREKPVEIKAIGEIGKTGVDEQSSYLFRYGSGCLAFLNSTINAPVDSVAEIIGSKGKIVIPRMFLAAQSVLLHLEGAEPVETELPFDEKRGFRFEIASASESIRKGELENGTMPLSDTVQIMETIDEIKSQLGLEFANAK